MHRTLLLATLMLGFVGCGEDEPEGFATFQECFDDKHDFGMGIAVPDAIVECCLSHPINGQLRACGASQPDCINFLTNNLNQTDATPSEVMDACSVYADQL